MTFTRPPLKALTVCVGYDDILKITAPWNSDTFDCHLIVTDWEDKKTPDLVDAIVESTLDEEGNGDIVPIAYCRTDSFYEDGAVFNKGKAIEWAFDILTEQGTWEGWIALLDADVLLPAGWVHRLNLDDLDPQNLYGFRRKMAPIQDRPAPYYWHFGGEYEVKQDTEIGGWLQLFHTSGAGPRPWYPTVWEHAGGCDSGFMLKYPREKREWLDQHVIHIGEDGKNWCGRATERIDAPGEVTPEMVVNEAAMKDLLDRRKQLGKKAFAFERLDRQARVR